MKMRLFHLILAGALLAAPSAFAQSMPFWKSYTQTRNLRDIIPSAGNDNSVAAWLGKKIDVTGGRATNLTRTGGSDNRTNISAAYVAAASPLSSYLTSTTTNRFTVYFGGVGKFPQIAYDVRKELSAGNIALYEHGAAMSRLTDAQRQAIQNTWGPTGARITAALGGGGSGMAELGCCGAPTQADLAGFGGAFPALGVANIADPSGHPIWAASMTDADEAYLETGIGTMASTPNSSRSIAPVLRPDDNVADSWSTGAVYAPARKLALATGALALDMPSTDAILKTSSVLDKFADEITWAIKNHLRMTVIVSPYVPGVNRCAIDPKFLQNTKEYLAYMLSKAPPPTEWVAEDYCLPGPDGSYSNSDTGDSDPDSANQVALYLSSLPVSPLGTAKPTIAGALSEADAVAQYNMYSSGNSASLTFDAPYAKTATPMPLNNIRNMMDYNLAALGGMAYQQSNSVDIQGGVIASTNPLHITITNGQLLVQGSQANIAIAGPAGNSVLGSNTNDKYITLFDPWTNQGAGFHFGGPDNVNAPLLYESDTADKVTSLTLSSGAEMNFTFHDNEAGSIGNFINAGVSKTTGMFAIQNFSSIQDNATGFEWAPRGVDEANRPWAASTADGQMVTFHIPRSLFSGNVNVNGNIAAKSINITKGGALAIGVGGGSTPAYITDDPYGNITISGSLAVGNGALTLGRFTKAQILGYPGPIEGMLLYDTDDHVEVTYRCPTGASCGWFPTQYGSALSNRP